MGRGKNGVVIGQVKGHDYTTGNKQDFILGDQTSTWWQQISHEPMRGIQAEPMVLSDLLGFAGKPLLKWSCITMSATRLVAIPSPGTVGMKIATSGTYCGWKNSCTTKRMVETLKTMG